MNIRAFAQSLEPTFWKWGTLNAFPREPARYMDVLDNVQGMTTPSTMHLLNLAVQQLGPNECYLEVGTWRGATLIGALLGNDAYGVAIDDDSMNEHDGDEYTSWSIWRKNVEAFGLTQRASYIDGSVPKAFSDLSFAQYKPAGVYLFDGDKSTEEAAYAGLEGVLPFLADEALIFVDDANEITIRMAVGMLCAKHPTQLFKILDIPTPGNCWPCFWNGIMALAYRRA